MIAARFCRAALGVAFCLVFVVGCQTSGVPTTDGQAARADTQTARAEAPKAGEAAPPLTLDTLDGKRKVKLASFEGRRPVVLFFGSYT